MNEIAAAAENAWFSDGVRFTCQSGCVRCCGGVPGDVFVTATEIRAIAELMELSVDEFENSYVRHYSSGQMSLTEKRNGDCVLLDAKKGCSVYAARPKQCRDFPFWPEVMESPFAWIKEANRCPGINVGELHEAPKIVQILRTQRAE